MSSLSPSRNPENDTASTLFFNSFFLIGHPLASFAKPTLPLRLSAPLPPCLRSHVSMLLSLQRSSFLPVLPFRLSPSRFPFSDRPRFESSAFASDSLPRKEVIQPHLPIRLPCYDFTPVIGLALDGGPLAVDSPALGTPNSHGVTGGVYKARERIHRSMLICDY